MNFFTKNYSDIRFCVREFRNMQRIDFFDDFQGASEEFIGLHARFWARMDVDDTPGNPLDIRDETLKIPMARILNNTLSVESIMKAVNHKIADIESEYYEEYQPCWYPLLDAQHTSQAVIDAVATLEGRRDEEICLQIEDFSVKQLVSGVLNIMVRKPSPGDRELAEPEWTRYCEEILNEERRGVKS